MKFSKPVFGTTILFVVVALSVYALAQTMMSIQIRNAEVRQTPSFLGKVLTRLDYGRQVPVYGQQRSWLKIGYPPGAGEGWVHTSALTRKKIVLAAGDTDVVQAATSDEIALAGKGFNQQVETEFKAQNPQLDFAWIDRMEAFGVSPKRIQLFLAKGRLSPKEEASDANYR